MLIGIGTERGAITLPFSHKMVSLLFGYHKNFKPQHKSQYSHFKATRTTKQLFTSLKRERKQPKQPASAIQSYLFYIISQKEASEKCIIKIKISAFVFTGNSVEKQNYCSFIRFILEKSQIPTNISANTCVLSKPP